MSGGEVVGVVYGRDGEAKALVEGLLRGFGLRPYSFEEALLRTSGGLPTTMETVRELFDGVQAVVVILTPDDLAITHPSLVAGTVTDADTRYTGQPRQNVLIESGMAIAALPSRTIFVRLGDVRRASDLDGVAVVDLASPGAAHRFAGLLRRAGCAVPPEVVVALPDVAPTHARARARESEPVYSDRQGVSLFEAARTSGLRDIEHRVPGVRQLPPSDFFARARAELAVSATTAASMFDQFDLTVRELLEAGKAVRVMILDPESPDLERVSRRENRSLGDDVRSVLRAVVQGGFAADPGFELRLAPRLYPFTGVMIDGSIGAQPSARPEDLDAPSSFSEAAEIRVQPGGYYTTQHHGPVLQFRWTPAPGPFHHFASDLRRQWAPARPATFDE